MEIKKKWPQGRLLGPLNPMVMGWKAKKWGNGQMNSHTPGKAKDGAGHGSRSLDELSESERQAWRKLYDGA